MACRMAWTLTNWTYLRWNGTMFKKSENDTCNFVRNGPDICQDLEWHSASIVQHSRSFNEATINSNCRQSEHIFCKLLFDTHDFECCSHEHPIHLRCIEIVIMRIKHYETWLNKNVFSVLFIFLYMTYSDAQFVVANSILDFIICNTILGVKFILKTYKHNQTCI